MTTRSGLLGVALLGLLGGCSAADLDITLSVTSPIALGAQGIIVPGDRCVGTGNKSSRCGTQRVKIKSYAIDPPDRLVVVEETHHDLGSSVTFRARSEGTARVTVVADNGYGVETLTQEVEVVRANRLTLAPMAKTYVQERLGVEEVSPPCESPYLFEQGVDGRFDFQLFADETPLYGGHFCPLTLDGEPVVATCTTGLLTLSFDQSTGAKTIRSSVDPAFSMEVELVGPEQVDGLELSEPFRLGNRDHLWALARVGGRSVCVDNLERRFQSDAGICQVVDRNNSPNSRGPGPYEIYRQAFVPCPIEAELGDGGLTATREYVHGKPDGGS